MPLVEQKRLSCEMLSRSTFVARCFQGMHFLQDTRILQDIYSLEESCKKPINWKNLAANLLLGRIMQEI